MVRARKQKISSNEIAGLNYSVTLLPSDIRKSFEELTSNPFFMQMIAYPFHDMDSESKMDNVRKQMPELLQLEDSDFPPKKERSSTFNEGVYDYYLKKFLDKIEEQELMYLIRILIQDKYLKDKKLLSVPIERKLDEEGYTLGNIESNLNKILGYKYEEGEGKRKRTDNELMNAIDSNKPVLFPDVLEKYIQITQEDDEIKISIDTEKYFGKLFKEYGFGDIDGFEDDVPLTDRDGKPIMDKKTGKQKTGRRFTGNFQFGISEVADVDSDSDKPKDEKIDDYAFRRDIVEQEKEQQLRSQFEDEEGSTYSEDAFEEESDLDRFIEDEDGNEVENPEWNKAHDRWYEEAFEDWKEEHAKEIEEDLEQYGEDDEYETSGETTSDEFISDNPENLEEKMLKAIEIAKAIFKPTKQANIKHVLKITPKQNKKGKESYTVDDWDATHTYDDLEEVHDAITEIQFDEKSMKEWIMKSIQDQRKSELKELVLDAITPENNFLTVGDVNITLVKYEYDTVDDLERALGDSISPESSEEYEDAIEILQTQVIAFSKILQEISDLIGEEIVIRLFKNTEDKKEVLDKISVLIGKAQTDLNVLNSWYGDDWEKGYHEEEFIGSEIITGEVIPNLWFDMKDSKNQKFKEEAANPETPLPALPKTKNYGDEDWLLAHPDLPPAPKEDIEKSRFPQTRKPTQEEIDRKERLAAQGELAVRLAEVPKLPNGEKRFQQIRNESRDWNSKLIEDSKDIPKSEQREILGKLLILFQGGSMSDIHRDIEGHGERWYDGAKGGLGKILSQSTFKYKRLDLKVDFISLWLNYIKGKSTSKILDPDYEEFNESVETELRETSWKGKIREEGDKVGGGIHLPIIARKGTNRNDRLRIDTRTYGVKGGTKFKTGRFSERRIRGAASKDIPKKDMNTLKRVIREFNRMRSMVA